MGYEVNLTEIAAIEGYKYRYDLLGGLNYIFERASSLGFFKYGARFFKQKNGCMCSHRAR